MNIHNVIINTIVITFRSIVCVNKWHVNAIIVTKKINLDMTAFWGLFWQNSNIVNHITVLFIDFHVQSKLCFHMQSCYELFNL